MAQNRRGRHFSLLLGGVGLLALGGALTWRLFSAPATHAPSLLMDLFGPPLFGPALIALGLAGIGAGWGRGRDVAEPPASRLRLRKIPGMGRLLAIIGSGCLGMAYLVVGAVLTRNADVAAAARVRIPFISADGSIGGLTGPAVVAMGLVVPWAVLAATGGPVADDPYRRGARWLLVIGAATAVVSGSILAVGNSIHHESSLEPFVYQALFSASLGLVMALGGGVVLAIRSRAPIDRGR